MDSPVCGLLAALKALMSNHPDYFVTTIDDPSPHGLEKVRKELRSLLSRGPKGRRTKVADLHEQQIMRWIVQQRQAGWTWETHVRTPAGREWSVSRIRRAYAAEVAGKTQEPLPRRPRKRRQKPNLAAEWLHRLVRALR
jgi:hypothetical protein